MRVEEFQGIRNAVPGPGIEPTQFQVDEGSDRYRQGSWSRRRGMIHADTQGEVLPGPITAIIPFDLPGVEHAIMVVSGTEVHGYVT